MSDTTPEPLSGAAVALPQSLGVTGALAEAAPAEVLLYLQDGRDPSSERQRRASPAARWNYRYPAVIQVGNVAACLFWLMTCLLVPNESRGDVLSWRL